MLQPLDPDTRALTFALLLGAYLLYFTPPLAANDTTASIAAGGIEFKTNADIEMRREDLSIQPGKIAVAYQFYNNAATAITETIAFPMPEIRSGSHSHHGIDPFYHLYDLLESAASIDPRPGKERGEEATLRNMPVRDFVERRFNGRGLLDFSVQADGHTIHPTMSYQALLPDGRNIARELFAAGIPLSKAYLLGWDTEGAWERFPQWRDKLRSLGYLDKEGLPAWNNQTIYFWQDTFAPQATHHVSHSYSPSQGYDFLEVKKNSSATPDLILADGRWSWADFCPPPGFEKRVLQIAHGKELLRVTVVDYILTTGAHWAKPIADFRLVVDAPTAGAAFFCWSQKPAAKTLGPKTIVTAKNFSPPHDLRILFLAPET